MTNQQERRAEREGGERRIILTTNDDVDVDVDVDESV